MGAWSRAEGLLVNSPPGRSVEGVSGWRGGGVHSSRQSRLSKFSLCGLILKMLVKEMGTRMRSWRPWDGGGRDGILLILGLRPWSCDASGDGGGRGLAVEGNAASQC